MRKQRTQNNKHAEKKRLIKNATSKQRKKKELDLR